MGSGQKAESTFNKGTNLAGVDHYCYFMFASRWLIRCTSPLPTSSVAIASIASALSNAFYDNMPPRNLPPRRTIVKPPLRHNTAHRQTSHSLILDEVYPPTEVFVSESGVHGEVMRISMSQTTTQIPSKVQSGDTHVLLLPGNPGIIEYYRPFLRKLWQKLSPDLQKVCHFHALGLPGHDLRELNGDREFVISDHVGFCRSYLQSKMLLAESEEHNLVMVGHSYGSHLALTVMETLAEEEVCQVSLVMLMPALWEIAYCAGLLTRLALADWRGLLSWLTWMVTNVTPPIMRDALLSSIGHDRESECISRKLVDGRRRSVFENITSLGRDELVNIRNPYHMITSKSIQSALLVYVDDDKWCPPQARSIIMDAFSGRIEVKKGGSGVTHAFVLNTFETLRVVDEVAPWLSDRIRSNSRSNSLSSTQDNLST